MINFNDLLVNRVVIHTINAKQDGQDSSKVDPSEDILEINHDALEIIRTRLIDAAGKNSKAFELEIHNDKNGSFHSISKDLSDIKDEQFIEKTKAIAELLASTQKRKNISVSYLMVLDCLNNDLNLPLVIVIKAEPHKALQFSRTSKKSQVSLLDKVFLSPSQKLYKIGIIYKKTKLKTGNVNDKYGCFIYDDQFRSDSHPAEYFYKNFLGFSIGNNSKIQSKRFFDKTETFINQNVKKLKIKTGMLSVLKTEFTIGQSATIDPIQFAKDNISEKNGLRDLYISTVCNELPLSIVKDKSLITSKLNKRQIKFPTKIYISGPEEGFDDKVEIISKQASLDKLDPKDPKYTIIKITGKPYNTID